MWKGQLRLSLVSINVEMFTAHKSGGVTSFNQIHKPTGKRVHYQKVVEGVGPVSVDEIRKGYEYEKGEYVLLEDDELDAVKLETKKTLDLVQFVTDDEIPPLYYDAAYYLAPADELAEDAFRVVRDAMRKAGKVGLGQLALRGKEYLVAIRPCGRGMLLETLHYEAEIKKSDSFFSDPGEVGRPRFARGGDGADREEDRQVRSQDLQGPLPGGAARADRPQAQVERPEDRSRGREAAQGDGQCHRPDGGAEKEPRERHPYAGKGEGAGAGEEDRGKEGAGEEGRAAAEGELMASSGGGYGEAGCAAPWRVG
jgi:Ku protein